MRGKSAIESRKHAGAGSVLLEFRIEEVGVELGGHILRLSAISIEQLGHGGELGHTSHIASRLPELVGIGDRHFLAEDGKQRRLFRTAAEKPAMDQDYIAAGLGICKDIARSARTDSQGS